MHMHTHMHMCMHMCMHMHMHTHMHMCMHMCMHMHMRMHDFCSSMSIAGASRVFRRHRLRATPALTQYRDAVAAPEAPGAVGNR